MTEGRRHSVDIPLSRTLVALKRVRSLRDPGTNSMSKFSPYVDNMKWETNASNDAVLELSNPVKHNLGMMKNDNLDIDKEGIGSNSDSNCCSRMHNPRVSDARIKLVHESTLNLRHKTFDPTILPYSRNLTDEEVDSYSEPNFELVEKSYTRVAAKKSTCGRKNKRFVAADVAMSRVGSPCISVSKAHTNSLTHTTLGFATEDVDVVDSNRTGCGISYCWSRTPKYSNTNLSSDAEDHECPLLSAGVGEITPREIALHLDSPRSLSHKYRPRSFNELVGQNVVAQSLLSGISKGKIAPIYLFHGPRGTGKTSSARIFAAALNCLSLQEDMPCGFCRECGLLFSGRSRDVKELDAGKTNRKDRVKALLKSASLAPFSSHFKVFIIEECQYLHGQTWAAIFNNLEELSRHSVFIMITSDLHKLPQNSISRCQRYHFLKIKDSDIVLRLQKICMEEGLDFENEALEFIAAKSDGSLRDAETLLDQLGLLAKRITLSLAHELIGVVSDDELLDLLDLALSADTANTVRRAREIMGSRVDPMQLISQLANLIMDILAGRRQPRVSEVCGDFVGRQSLAEIGMQQLKHALKILSETEKQFKTSKNQATWLTVALLQFSSEDPSCPRSSSSRGEGGLSTISPRENLKRCYGCSCSKSNCSETECERKNLEAIWRRTAANCQSNSLRNFLQKEGSLRSIYVDEGLAIAEVEFHHRSHASRAEKSWKLIAGSLQHVIGCNVEIRIYLVPRNRSKNTKLKMALLNLLNCCTRAEEMLDSRTLNDHQIEASLKRNASVDSCTSNQNQQCLARVNRLNADCKHNSNCIPGKVVNGGNMQGNARSPGGKTYDRDRQDNPPNECHLQSDYSKKVDKVSHMSIEGSEVQPNCFARTLKSQRRFLPSEVAQAICLRLQPHNKPELSLRKNALLDTDFCANVSHIFCSRSNSHVTCNSRDGTCSGSDSRFSAHSFCWRISKPSLQKNHLDQQHLHGSHLVGCFLPCMAAEQSSPQAEDHAYELH